MAPTPHTKKKIGVFETTALFKTQHYAGLPELRGDKTKFCLGKEFLFRPLHKLCTSPFIIKVAASG
jgi:hypothetical protein